MQIISPEGKFQRVNRANLLFWSGINDTSIRERFVNRCCLSSETHMHSRPSASRLLHECISVCTVFARVLHGWAGKLERIYVRTYDNCTTKVNALNDASVGMCMNNVISACVCINRSRRIMIRISAVIVRIFRIYYLHIRSHILKYLYKIAVFDSFLNSCINTHWYWDVFFEISCCIAREQLIKNLVFKKIRMKLIEVLSRVNSQLIYA